MPDANPKYEKVPRPESIDFFKSMVFGHGKVSVLEPLSPTEFRVVRRDLPELVIHLTNIYIVSLADVEEILSKHAEVNCIVTMSAWNSYTDEAKEECCSRKIGLFKSSEIRGALNFQSDRFFNYKSKK